MSRANHQKTTVIFYLCVNLKFNLFQGIGTMHSKEGAAAKYFQN